MSEPTKATDPSAPFVGFTAAKRSKAVNFLRHEARMRRAQQRGFTEGGYADQAARAKRDADAYEAAIAVLEALPALVSAYRTARRAPTARPPRGRTT